jgi:hypothetical protein
VLVAVLGAGCGGGSDDERAGATAAPTTDEAETSTTGAPAPPSSPTTTASAGDGEAAATLAEAAGEGLADEGDAQLADLALELLITPAELAGQTFVDTGYVPPEGAGPCGLDTDAAHPPDVLVGTALADAEGRAITQELRAYPSTDTSAEAYAAHRDALACGTDGAGTTFGPPTDVSEVVGAGAASEVTVTVEDESGVVVTALVADVVLTFRIAAPAATPATLDPREVAAFGVGKVLAALEAGSE